MINSFATDKIFVYIKSLCTKKETDSMLKKKYEYIYICI